MRGRGGLALLVAAGVLGILALLAAAFVTLSRLERRAARQRLAMSLASLLARSGVEDALARMSAGQDPTLPAAAYGGENWDGDASGTLSGYEDQHEVFRNTAAGSPADLTACPVRHAMRPSFFVKAAGGNPAVQPVDGRHRAYSGRLGVALPAEARLYALKIEDESAKINVNGGFTDDGDRDADGVPDRTDAFVASPPDQRVSGHDMGRGWNAQLVRVLNLLGSQPEVSIAGLGDRILAARPRGGFRSVREVEAALGVATDLSPYLTVSSWVDPGVVHPNAFAAQPPRDAYAEVQKLRPPLALEEGGRPPVNLNAAERPVLAALIDGLGGVSCTLESKPHAQTIPSATAAAIVSRLISARSTAPFATWRDFESFCDGLVPGVITGMNGKGGGGGNLDGADLLKSNFDPNARLNKRLPDQLLFRWIDKSDLTVWSTEGSLGPTGTFRISAVGRVLGRDGRLEAECVRTVLADAFSLLRQGSQRDFETGSFLSLAGIPTTGATAFWGGGKGRTLMSYPEAPMAVLAGKASAVDGGFGLATVQVEDAAPSGALEAPFLHHFDDGWDADLVRPGGDPARQVPGPRACDTLLTAAPDGSSWPDTSVSSPAVEPNTLCPDGFHAQTLRSPGFKALANLPPVFTGPLPGARPCNRGAIGFWLKSMKQAYMDPGKGGAAGSDMCFTCFRTGAAWDESQVLFLGRSLQDYFRVGIENRILVGMDNGTQGSEVQKELTQASSGTWIAPGLRWQLVTAQWDTSASVPGSPPARKPGDAELKIDGVVQEQFASPSGSYVPSGYSPGLDTNLSEDLLATDPMFVIGGQADLGPYGFSYVNSVMDEFEACDFGSGNSLQVDVWASNRYADGRYYKGEGTFTSGTLSPASMGRLVLARWTAYVPTEPATARRRELRTAGAPPSSGTPRLQDSRMRKAFVDVSLVRPDGTQRPLAQGAVVGERLPFFSYEVKMRVQLRDPLSDPLLETPYFDDVSFGWQRDSGPVVRAWDGD